jgi:hypothetical protein
LRLIVFAGPILGPLMVDAAYAAAVAARTEATSAADRINLRFHTIVVTSSK